MLSPWRWPEMLTGRKTPTQTVTYVIPDIAYVEQDIRCDKTRCCGQDGPNPWPHLPERLPHHEAQDVQTGQERIDGVLPGASKQALLQVSWVFNIDSQLGEGWCDAITTYIMLESWKQSSDQLETRCKITCFALTKFALHLKGFATQMRKWFVVCIYLSS